MRMRGELARSVSAYAATAAPQGKPATVAVSGRMATTAVLLLVLLLFAIAQAPAGRAVARPGAVGWPDAVPAFEVDPFWPRPLPNDWIVGQVAGVAVDERDHVWIVHRPGSLTEREAGLAQDPPLSRCCIPAPPVIEFDPEGNVVRAWGGPGPGYEWPASEHGIFVDGSGRVWIGSNGAGSAQVLAFSREGEFRLQIGKAAETGGSNHPDLLDQPADIFVDDAAGELYVADGYGNRRVIVFDARTGAYRRHWGAYGEPPEDVPLEPYDPSEPPARHFRSPVHALQLTSDGFLYVADRVNNRIQVFQKDGSFVREAFVAPRTLAMGSVWDIDASPDEQWLYVADGTNNLVWILERERLEVVGRFGRAGRWAGQFQWLHNVAVDSEGNLYTGEVETGKRVQKFVRRGAE